MIIELIFLIFIRMNTGLPSKSYYLIPIDTNSSLNNSPYCSQISINKNLYHIPSQCHHHLLCDSYQCDDKSFRCIKIRETLCCIYNYIQTNCEKEILKDQFRSIYFHSSIQHGYCEINLERIERNDFSYCLTNYLETTIVISSTRLPFKPRYRFTTQSAYLRTNISSKISFVWTNFFILFLSISL